MDATLKTANSAGISKFKVDQLSIYLVERTAVLDITLPDFSFDFVIDIPDGSWISPLKIAFNDEINVRFSSPKIQLSTRGKVSVKDAKLSMESTRLSLDLGDYDLQLVSMRTGTLDANPGIGQLLTGLLKKLAPQLIKNWTPVAEKMLNERLDEELKELQLSDLINPPQ